MTRLILLVLAAAVLSTPMTIMTVSSTTVYGNVYENQEANFKIQYPSTWMTESKGLPESVDVIIFPQEFAYEPQPSVLLSIQNMYFEEPLTANISELAEGAFDILEAEPSLRIINTTSNATVTIYNGTKTLPASIIHAYDFGGLPDIPSNEGAQEMDISTIPPGNRYLTTFEYDASRQNFTKYLPDVQEMIKSFQLLRE